MNTTMIESIKQYWLLVNNFRVTDYTKKVHPKCDKWADRQSRAATRPASIIAYFSRYIYTSTKTTKSLFFNTTLHPVTCTSKTY